MAGRRGAMTDPKGGDGGPRIHSGVMFREGRVAPEPSGESAPEPRASEPSIRATEAPTLPPPPPDEGEEGDTKVYAAKSGPAPARVRSYARGATLESIVADLRRDPRSEK